MTKKLNNEINNQKEDPRMNVDNLISYYNSKLKEKIRVLSIKELEKMQRKAKSNDGTGIYEAIGEVIEETKNNKVKLTGIDISTIAVVSSLTKKEKEAKKDLDNDDETKYEEQELEEDDYYYEDN